MQTADDTTPVWELRSTNDYASSSNTHTSFGDHATDTANADADSKAERMGYHMGDYAFVQTPEGGLYLETNDDIPASETLIDLSEKNPIVAQQIWGLRSVGKHESDAADQAAYANYSTESANEEAQKKSEEVGYPTAAEIGEDSLVQLDKWYTVFDADSNPDVDDHGYQRATTPRFSADSDDVFMRSMIE